MAGTDPDIFGATKKKKTQTVLYHTIIAQTKKESDLQGRLDSRNGCKWAEIIKLATILEAAREQSS